MGHIVKLILLFNLSLASCGDGEQRNVIDTKRSNADTVLQIDAEDNNLPSTRGISSNDDTLIIDRQAAVLIEPDSIRIEKQKRKDGEEAFYTGADDYMFYMNTAHEFLDSVKIKTFEAKDKMVIQFINSDKTPQIIRLDTLTDLWNIYFFEPSRNAKKVDMTAIDEEYDRYFK